MIDDRADTDPTETSVVQTIAEADTHPVVVSRRLQTHAEWPPEPPPPAIVPRRAAVYATAGASYVEVIAADTDDSVALGVYFHKH
jgi:hypothetical protein